MKDLLIQQGVHKVLQGKSKKAKYITNKIFEEWMRKLLV